MHTSTPSRELHQHWWLWPRLSSSVRRLERWRGQSETLEWFRTWFSVSSVYLCCSDGHRSNPVSSPQPQRPHLCPTAETCVYVSGRVTDGFRKPFSPSVSPSGARVGAPLQTRHAVSLSKNRRDFKQHVLIGNVYTM